MLEYDVINSNEFEFWPEYIEEIRKRIADGWQLQGGASVLIRLKPGWHGDHEEEYVYFQTLTKGYP